jgi:hypothetical protein
MLSDYAFGPLVFSENQELSYILGVSINKLLKFNRRYNRCREILILIYGAHLQGP